MSLTTAHSVVAPSASTKRFAGFLVILYALVSIVPLLWIVATSLKTPPDSIAYPPKVLFHPSIEGYCNLFTTRTRQTPEYIQSLGPPQSLCDETVRKRNMVIAGPSNFLPRFVNSLIIAFGSTFFVVDGVQTIAAGALRGLNDTRVPLLFAAVSFWVVGFATSYTLAFLVRMEAVGIWIGFTVGLGLYALLLVWRFNALTRRGFMPAAPGHAALH